MKFFFWYSFGKLFFDMLHNIFKSFLACNGFIRMVTAMKDLSEKYPAPGSHTDTVWSSHASSSLHPLRIFWHVLTDFLTVSDLYNEFPGQSFCLLLSHYHPFSICQKMFVFELFVIKLFAFKHILSSYLRMSTLSTNFRKFFQHFSLSVFKKMLAI